MTSTLVFGGTFDPVHFGHLRSALALLACFDEARLVMIPCQIPPHRPQPAASAIDRLEMLRLAAGETDLEVDDCELKREGPSFTFDTLTAYRQSVGESPLYFVMGSDAWVTLPDWFRWEELCDVAHLIILTRPGEVIEEPLQLKSWADPRRASLEASQNLTCGRIIALTLVQVPVSATAIRQAIENEQSIDAMVPEAVGRYIEFRDLYRTKQTEH